MFNVKTRRAIYTRTCNKTSTEVSNAFIHFGGSDRTTSTFSSCEFNRSTRSRHIEIPLTMDGRGGEIAIVVVLAVVCICWVIGICYCLRIRNSLRPGPSLSIDGDPLELERVADEFFFGPQDDATAFESRDFEVDEADEFDSQVSIEQKSNCSHCSPTNEGISASISTDDMETPSQKKYPLNELMMGKS